MKKIFKKILNSFNKKIVFALISLILLLVIILYIILTPAIFSSIEKNKNTIIRILNKELEDNFKVTLSDLQSVQSNALEQSTTKTKDNLQTQADKIISFSRQTLFESNSSFIEQEKKFILKIEFKRIQDLTKHLTKQLQLYLSEADYRNMQLAMDDLLSDHSIRFAFMYQNRDKKYYEKFNFSKNNDLNNKARDYFSQSTEHSTFINKAFLSGACEMRESVYDKEAVIEAAQIVKAGSKVLGLVNICFSIQRLYDEIIENNKKITAGMEKSFNTFQKDSLKENETRVTHSTSQLNENFSSLKKIFNTKLKSTQYELIKNVTDLETKQALLLSGYVKNIIISIGLIFLIIGILVAIKLAKTFSKPVSIFAGHIKNISNNDFSKRLELETGDEFETLAKSFNDMCCEIKDSRDRLAEWNKKLEITVLEKTSSIKNLLDNAGQGFLTFGNDLIIDSEFSSECLKIFGTNIEKNLFVELMFPGNPHQQDFTKRLLLKLFLITDKLKYNIYFPLLPTETIIKGKIIKMEYKQILPEKGTSSAAKFMVILTDMTLARELENKMEEERKNLKMVVKVMVNYNDFTECVHKFRHFIKVKLLEFFKPKISGNITENIFEIFRNVHTFKGLFSQFYMANLVDCLHQIEHEIVEIRQSNKPVRMEDMKEIFLKNNSLKILETDLSLLKEMLGENFFKEEKKIVIDKVKLIEIERKIVSYLSPVDCRNILPELSKFRSKPFGDLLFFYRDYLRRISEELNKSVHPLEIIEEGKIYVEPEKYDSLIQSLVHIFRNSITHGIEEDSEERIKAGKDEYGSVQCRIKLIDYFIELLISDDGGGIDTEKIKKIALANNFINSETLKNMNENDILNLIFTDGFSTKDSADHFSGRGIGLSAVKQEIERMGGLVSISSVKRKGSEFRLIIPFIDSCKIPELNATDIMKPIIENAERYFNSILKIPVKKCNIDILINQKIYLNKFAAIISIKGAFSGTIIMSVDDIMAENIYLKTMNAGFEPEEDERAEFIESAITENLNVILGNSIKNMKDIEDKVMITPPSFIFADNFIYSSGESKNCSCVMLSECGKLVFYIINKII